MEMTLEREEGLWRGEGKVTSGRGGGRGWVLCCVGSELSYIGMGWTGLEHHKTEAEEAGGSDSSRATAGRLLIKKRQKHVVEGAGQHAQALTRAAGLACQGEIVSVCLCVHVGVRVSVRVCTVSIPAAAPGRCTRSLR
jgi:hypothetical protein